MLMGIYSFLYPFSKYLSSAIICQTLCQALEIQSLDETDKKGDQLNCNMTCTVTDLSKA